MPSPQGAHKEKCLSLVLHWSHTTSPTGRGSEGPEGGQGLPRTVEEKGSKGAIYPGLCLGT